MVGWWKITKITTLPNHGVGTRSKSRHQRSPGVYGLHNQWHRARSHVGRMDKEKAQIPRRGPKGQQPIGTWEVGKRYLWAQSSTSRGLQTCPPGHLAPLDGSHHWAPWSEDRPTDLATSRRSWNWSNVSNTTTRWSMTKHVFLGSRKTTETTTASDFCSFFKKIYNSNNSIRSIPQKDWEIRKFGHL